MGSSYAYAYIYNSKFINENENSNVGCLISANSYYNPVTVDNESATC